MKKNLLLLLLFTDLSQAMESINDPIKEDACYLAHGYTKTVLVNEKYVNLIARALEIIRKEHPNLTDIRVKPKNCLLIKINNEKDHLFRDNLKNIYKGIYSGELSGKQIFNFDCVIDTQTLIAMANQQGIQAEYPKPIGDPETNIILDSKNKIWNFIFIKNGFNSVRITQCTKRISIGYDPKNEKIVSHHTEFKGSLANLTEKERNWINS